MNKLYIGLVAILVMIVAVAGCTSSSSTTGNTPTPAPTQSVTATPVPSPTINPNDPLIGTWTAHYSTKTYTFRFFANGSDSYDNGTLEYNPPVTWTRFDDTHYRVVGKSAASNLTMDANHTSLRFDILPELLFTKQ